MNEPEQIEPLSPEDDVRTSPAGLGASAVPHGRRQRARGHAGHWQTDLLLPTPRPAPTVLHHGSAFPWLASLEPASVDLVITDPPYASLEKHREHGTTTRLTNKWFETIPNESFPELFGLIYRVLRNNRHFYLFCDAETMFVAKPAAEAAGFKFWKPIVWDKLAIGLGYHYRARYEVILFFEKGKRRLADLGTADVLPFKRIRSDDAYPTEKPVELLDVLVRQSSEPGELVVDPFFGSGSTAVAAIKAGRGFAGADISEDAMACATCRVEGLRTCE